MLRKMFYIAGGLVLTIALLGSMGLGAWNYSLNNKLEQSQADYTALQNEYKQLDSEYSQSRADYESQLDQAQSELEDAKSQIQKLERDLNEVDSQNKALETKISNIQSKVAMLHAFWFTSETAFAQRVEQSDDEQLKELYKAMNEAQSWDGFVDFMNYLIESITETSGIQSSPIVNAVSPLHGG